MNIVILKHGKNSECKTVNKFLNGKSAHKKNKAGR